MNLRQATDADSEFSYQTKKAAFRAYVEQAWGWGEAVQRQLHDRRFPEQDLRIVQASGRDVGVLAVVREDDCLKLNQLFILPEHQGNGIGSRFRVGAPDCSGAPPTDPDVKISLIRFLSTPPRRGDPRWSPTMSA